jgi:hypothetical protein
MLQFPAMMRQWPSPPLIPASTLLPVHVTTQEDELLLAMAESDLEDKVLLLSPFLATSFLPTALTPSVARCSVLLPLVS